MAYKLGLINTFVEITLDPRKISSFSRTYAYKKNSFGKVCHKRDENFLIFLKNGIFFTAKLYS
jgi:hypothetical protein